MAIKEGYQEDAFDNVDLTLARQPLRNDAQARSEMERVLSEMETGIRINTNTTIRLNLQISISLKVKGAGRLGQEPLGPTFTHYERNAGAGAGAAQPPEEREISSETSASAEHEISSDTSESAEEDEVQAEASRNRGNPITRFFRRLFGR